MQAIGQDLLRYWTFIKLVGVTPSMEEYEKRKMSIFNQLNFLGIVTGVIVPIIGFFFNDHLPPLAWFVAGSPLAISLIVLWLNSERYYEHARLVYFSLYPVATCLVYFGKVDVGIELFFILYGVLSVFFLQETINIIFSFSLSAACYLIATVVPHDYYFRLVSTNYAFYVFNHLTALGFIFYALYLVKQENTGYQFSLISKGRELHRRNLDIEKQKQEIDQKAFLLEQQTRKLTELNNVKNKLFSVIAHDLKTPMYALRNLFNNMQQSNIPAREIKELLPGIATEMNYTTSLMENLLQWAKSQMVNAPVHPEVLDVQSMIADVLALLQLQATNKKIYLETRVEQPLYGYADREMINLVLRNLLSNAIKFTPEKGTVSVGALEKNSCLEIFVQDTGIGMSDENMQQLFSDAFFTTRGTNDESGTGLGLKLCKEFLEKNGGQISVQSKPGKGSKFTFTLPRFVEQPN
jgi:two-component system, sensor histidine kinase and response regulator